MDWMIQSIGSIIMAHACAPKAAGCIRSADQLGWGNKLVWGRADAFAGRRPTASSWRRTRMIATRLVKRTSDTQLPGHDWAHAISPGPGAHGS